jgi:serine/threonine protein kinase/tetratricopeptide (TPR) repeat protein
MIGKTISHYKILEKLGEGGMGEVYLAEDTKLKRRVALKFLAPHLTLDQEAKERFIHEAQAASALNHPNIVTIYEIDETEGQTFIAMEFIDGPTLRQRIESGPLEIDDALDIALQSGDGLKEAHDNDITHRDIKSDNMMMDSKGRTVKITDFGLAKLKGRASVTKTGTTIGTLAYASPEQVSGKKLDHRSDIFSFGVVLYELLTGKLPFRGDYEATVVYAIMNEDPQPIGAIREGVPMALNEIIQKALAKNPGHRYPSIAELLTDLKKLKQDLESGVPARRKYIFWKKERRKRIWWSAVLVALLAILITIVTKLLLFKKETTITRIPISVMYFNNLTGESKYNYLRKGLAEMVITDLGQSRFLQVLTFQRMFDLLGAMGQEDVEVIDESIGFQVCNFAKTQVMIRGSIMKTGNTFALNAQVLDVATKRQLSGYSVKGEGEDSILGHLIDELSRRIKSGLAVSERIKKGGDEKIAELTTRSLEAYRFYMAGREASFKQYHQDAVVNFERALSLDPGFRQVYRCLARQYFLLSEKSKALVALERLKKFSFTLDEKEMLTILVEDAIIKKDWDSQINYLKQLIRIDPDDIGAHFDLGKAYYHYKMRFDDGIAEFEKVLELDSKGLTPYSIYTYNFLGYAYMKKGEFAKGLDAFKQYVALSPNQPDPLDSFGEACRIVGRYEEAIQSFQKALELKPDYTICYAHLGDTYLEKGMYNKALDAYSKYLFLSASKSDTVNAHFVLGRFYFLKEEYGKALQECEKVLDLDPEMVKAHWIRGLSSAKEKDFDGAEFEAHEITRLIEKSHAENLRLYHHHLLGEVSLGKEHYPQAIENLQKSSIVGSLEKAFFLKSLAEAYFKMGLLDLSIEKCKAVFEINPDDAQAHYWLGLVYEKKEDAVKAKEHYHKFLNIWNEADEDLPQLSEVKKRLAEL